MNLPDITKWNAGVAHDEVMFNAVSDTLNFLLNPPECSVQQTSAQTIPTGTTTATAVVFDTLNTDNDSMWDSGDPTVLTIQTPGWYEIEWAVSWATKSSDTTLRMQALYLAKNYAIASAIAHNDFINDSVTTPQVRMSYDLFLVAGDQLSVGLIQSTGSNLNTASSASVKDQQTSLRVRWASL